MRNYGQSGGVCLDEAWCMLASGETIRRISERSRMLSTLRWLTTTRVSRYLPNEFLP